MVWLLVTRTSAVSSDLRNGPGAGTEKLVGVGAAGLVWTTWGAGAAVPWAPEPPGGTGCAAALCPMESDWVPQPASGTARHTRTAPARSPLPTRRICFPSPPQDALARRRP